jgi:hypothetical protein
VHVTRAERPGAAVLCSTLALLATVMLSIAAVAHARTSLPLSRIRALAEQGNQRAELQLGFYYDQGKGGLPQDPRLAAKWYMKSAEQGYRRAEYNLGVYYYYGKGGLPQDPRLAVIWIKKSAAQNFPIAINGLRALENAHAQTRTTVAHATAPSASQPATSVMPASAAPLATTDNQQRDQSLRSFWQAYFQHSNAKLVEFGTPALVQPVSFAGPP